MLGNLIIIPREVQKQDYQKKKRWWNCVQIVRDAKLKTGKRGRKTELTGRSPLRKRRTGEEEEEEEEKEKTLGNRMPLPNSRV